MISRIWKAQRDFLKKTYNQDVNSYFRDIPDTDDNLSINTPRKAAKSACLIRPKDSQNIALLKMMTFYHIVQKVHLSPQIWGLPTQIFLDTQKHKSQVILLFKEKQLDAYRNERIPITAQVSFRVEETEFTESKVKALAKKIKTLLTKPNYSFSKGQKLFTYNDHAGGWAFQLYVTSESEAKQVIGKCFEIKDAGTPDWDKYLKEHIDNKNYSRRETIRIMGETIKKPRKRPLGTVYFAYAELLIPHLPEPITLVDTTGTRPRSLVIV